MVMIQAADTPELFSTVHLSWNKGITDHLAITLFLKNICSCGHAVMSQRLLHWDTRRFFFFFFYPYIQASSTQINYLHVHLIPWTFHHAALSTSLPRPLKCSYIWFQTTELLLLKTLKFIQHNTAPARTELCLSLIDLEKDKRHIISFYVDNKSTRNAQYRPTVLNDDFVLVCFNETTFWY